MGVLNQVHAAVGTEKLAESVAGIAPYFNTIDAKFTIIEDCYAEALLKNETKVQNHLVTVHAIAMCNLVELVGGSLIDLSLPEGRIWIPQEMNVQYLAKAKSDLRAVCDLRDTDMSIEGVIPVVVDIYDTDDIKVLHAVVSMNVKVIG